eukprot:c25710_g1_i1 orf=256-1485(-)
MALVASTFVEGNADAVEFCPTPPFHHVLAAATYTLHHQGDAPFRVGGLHVFSLENGGRSLRRLQQIETSGIFDIKWRPDEEEKVPCLAQASADGSLRLYSSGEVQVHDPFQMRQLTMQNITSSMCLSLDWDPFSQCNQNQISVSHSDGSLSMVDVGNSQMQVGQHGEAHSFEVWSVTYDSWKPHVIYSGGDDCHFCGWDLREGLHRPVFRETKIHQMGVCTIQSNPHWEHAVATGSYDESLRLWDIRMLECPIVADTLRLGGGVWRLKWHPSDKGLLLAACMHNGFMIVNVNDGKMAILEEYKDHKSLAYGADWCKGAGRNCLETCSCLLNMPMEVNNAVGIHAGILKSGQEKSILNSDQEHTTAAGSSFPQPSAKSGDSRTKCFVATCSFYDCSLHVWLPAKLPCCVS